MYMFVQNQCQAFLVTLIHNLNTGNAVNNYKC
jgi:hypothetical protein